MASESHARHPSQPVWALVKSLPSLREHLAALTAELKGLREDLAAARKAAAARAGHEELVEAAEWLLLANDARAQARMRALLARLRKGEAQAAEDTWPKCAACGHDVHYNTCGLVCAGVPCDCRQPIPEVVPDPEDAF